MALLRSVAERDHPLGAMADVVTRLLHRLRGDSGQIGVRRLRQSIHLQERKQTEKQLADNRESEVALRQLDNQRISVVRRVSEIRQRVFVSTASFGHSGPLEQEC